MPEPFTADQRANLSALIAEGADSPGALRLITAIHGGPLPPLPATAYPPHALPIRRARPTWRTRWQHTLDRVIPAASLGEWHRW